MSVGQARAYATAAACQLWRSQGLRFEACFGGWVHSVARPAAPTHGGAPIVAQVDIGGNSMRAHSLIDDGNACEGRRCELRFNGGARSAPADDVPTSGEESRSGIFCSTSESTPSGSGMVARRRHEHVQRAGQHDEESERREGHRDSGGGSVSRAAAAVWGRPRQALCGCDFWAAREFHREARSARPAAKSTCSTWGRPRHALRGCTFWGPRSVDGGRARGCKRRAEGRGE